MVVASNTVEVPVEGVLQQVPSTKLLVNDQELGTATLYITENNVLWTGGVRPGGGSAPNLSLLYPTISLHAIQRDPTPALYMVVNYELGLTENATDDDDYDADNEPMTQLRFIPPSEDELQAMYTALCQGQALHPDPQDADDDPYMDGEDFHDCSDEFEDAEESEATPEAAAERLTRMRIHNHNGTHENEEAEGDQIGEE